MAFSNRFNGFRRRPKAVETAGGSHRECVSTWLKPGENEKVQLLFLARLRCDDNWLIKAVRIIYRQRQRNSLPAARPGRAHSEIFAEGSNRQNRND